MNETRDRRFLDAFTLVVGIFAGLIAGVVLLALFRASHAYFATVGSLIFLLLWSAAWRSQPSLALGIFLGVAAGCTAVYVTSIAGLRHVPIWLPPLPLALVALTLFVFGFLAWRAGRNG